MRLDRVSTWRASHTLTTARHQDWLVSFGKTKSLVSNVLIIRYECQFWSLTLKQQEFAGRLRESSKASL